MPTGACLPLGVMLPVLRVEESRLAGKLAALATDAFSVSFSSSASCAGKTCECVREFDACSESYSSEQRDGCTGQSCGPSVHRKRLYEPERCVHRQRIHMGVHRMLATKTCMYLLTLGKGRLCHTCRGRKLGRRPAAGAVSGAGGNRGLVLCNEYAVERERVSIS